MPERPVRVVVAGAAGFLGRATVRALGKGGHDVVGLIRRPASAEDVRTDGGTPIVADVTDARTLHTPLKGADAVIHLAQPTDGDLAARRRVRVEGGQQLARVAVASGCARFVVGSGYWVYQGQPGLIDEESPIAPRSISLVNHEAEVAVCQEATPAGLSVTIVRPGMVYGPGSWFAEMVRELQGGTYRYIADGTNRLSPIHLDDAGSAFRSVLEHGAPGGTYLAVDDRPVETRAFAEDVAVRISAAPPRSLTMADARREWGDDLAELNVADRAASNRRLRALGWTPRYPGYPDGLSSVLDALRTRRAEP
jgi:nucleoside-diphosphate-sugar epimerase